MTTEQTMPELLLCPFCGSNKLNPYEFGKSAGEPECYVQCVGCTTTGPLAWTKEEAIAAWNRRASIAATKQAEPVAWLMPDGCSTRDKHYAENYGGKPLYLAPQPAQPAGMISIQEAWEAAGGNPDIKATKEELLFALKALDVACEEADSSSQQTPVPTEQEEPLKWQFTGIAGMKRHLTEKQYQAQTPDGKKWYAPICDTCGPASQPVPTDMQEQSEKFDLDTNLLRVHLHQVRHCHARDLESAQKTLIGYLRTELMRFVEYAKPAVQVPSGCKIVPIEPTHEMCVEACDVLLTDWWQGQDSDGKKVMQVRECSAHDIYKAMVEASPAAVRAEEVPEGWQFERDEETILVSHPDIGEIVARKDSLNAALDALYRLADAITPSPAPKKEGADE